VLFARAEIDTRMVLKAYVASGVSLSTTALPPLCPLTMRLRWVGDSLLAM
jgi:hypothetical protein